MSLKGDSESDAAFSRRIGVATSTWKQYGKGSSPSLDVLLKVADATSVSIEWLAGRAIPQSRELSIDGDGMPKDMVMVPVIDAQPSAGAGSNVEGEAVTAVIALRRDLVRGLGVSSAGALRVLEARGNSMEPTIRAGDLILVDTAIEQVEDEGVYVFRFGGALVVKRIRFTVAAGVELISDNGGIADRIPEGDLPELHAAGRVVRVIRAL